ncbi:MAG TPA: ribosome biogenesis GTPase YlqF [Candidatus Spyradocola merdavium]|nr:ribosome biogenesis GTPase YlqF [Candidatus Spyradocola merdavium]
MDIQWYPGHMAKARRMLAESVKLVDVVIEMVDARAPASTRNPDFDDLFGTKPRVVVLNKADLADPEATRAWIRAYRARGWDAISFSANAGKGVKEAVSLVERAARPVVERMKAKGVNKTVRAMIVGIPNVGKSTFINRLRGSAAAKAGNRPGVTRGKQWIVVGPYLEFLDTPGMLWPKFEDKEAARRLAFLGSIRGEIMDNERLSAELLEFLRDRAPEGAKARLKIDMDAEKSGEQLLEEACRRRGWLLPGARPDTERASALILDEFRSGKMGRLTLEAPVQAPEGEDENGRETGD